MVGESGDLGKGVQVDQVGLGAGMSPWWALWINLGGVGEWQFAGWLYVAEQDLAPGNPRAVVDRVIQGLSDQLTSPAVALNAESKTAASSATPGVSGVVKCL